MFNNGRINALERRIQSLQRTVDMQDAEITRLRRRIERFAVLATHTSRLYTLLTQADVYRELAAVDHALTEAMR